MFAYCIGKAHSPWMQLAPVLNIHASLVTDENVNARDKLRTRNVRERKIEEHNRNDVIAFYIFIYLFLSKYIIQERGILRTILQNRVKVTARGDEI